MPAVGEPGRAKLKVHTRTECPTPAPGAAQPCVGSSARTPRPRPPGAHGWPSLHVSRVDCLETFYVATAFGRHSWPRPTPDRSPASCGPLRGAPVWPLADPGSSTLCQAFQILRGGRGAGQEGGTLPGTYPLPWTAS